MVEKFYYDPKSKTFSDQQTAEQHAGELDQAVIHLLKLEFRLNYKSDREKHISNIANWLFRCKINQMRDKSSKGEVFVMKYYQKSLNKIKLAIKATKLFRSKYGWNGTVMISDIDNVIWIVIQCMSYETRNRIIGYLSSYYPPEF